MLKFLPICKTKVQHQQMTIIYRLTVKPSVLLHTVHNNKYNPSTNVKQHLLSYLYFGLLHTQLA